MSPAIVEEFDANTEDVWYVVQGEYAARFLSREDAELFVWAKKLLARTRVEEMGGVQIFQAENVDTAEKRLERYRQERWNNFGE